tara:strand:- start:17 stop:262 length:246 start_codon:yes stop_codon:yes gene_type:complete
MGEKLTKLIVDLSKPAGERETVIELTDEEIAEHELNLARATAENLAEKKALDQKKADAQAGRDALVALGLTEAQINALIGA